MKAIRRRNRAQMQEVWTLLEFPDTGPIWHVRQCNPHNRMDYGRSYLTYGQSWLRIAGEIRRGERDDYDHQHAMMRARELRACARRSWGMYLP